MAYTIYLGSVDKRVNSTLRPDYTNWASYSVVLKTPTDYDKPVFTLQDEFAAFAPLNYNYAVAFGRYYWITSLRAIRTNIIEVSLTLDIFATRRDEIMNTKAFIEYGANTFDASAAGTYRIPDPRRPLSKNCARRVTTGDITGGEWSNEGFYVLQCLNGSGGIDVFALTKTELDILTRRVNTDIASDINAITSDTTMTPDEKLAELTGLDLKQSLLSESAIKAILSVIWLPFNYSIVSDVGFAGLREVQLGRYGTNMFAAKLEDHDQWKTTANFPINWPVADWQRNNCQGSMYLPFFGTIPVPIDQIINTDTISARLSLDLFTGDLSITVGVANYTFYTATTNVSAPYGLGQTVVGTRAISGGIQMVGGALQGLCGALDIGAGIAGLYLSGGLVGGSSIAGGAASIVSGAGNAFEGYKQTVQPVMSSAGNLGGLAPLGLSLDAVLTIIYYPAAIDADFEALYGHPVMMVDKPVLGFCKTRGFSIALKNEPQYISIINAAMDGGMFIE